jgi:dimethylaniline monooxygenase (N-oxide forming)
VLENQRAPQPVFLPWLRGINVVNEDAWPGNPPPVDCLQASLFDTMYVHPAVRNTMIVWEQYNTAALKGAWLASGSEGGWDQHVAGLPAEKNHLAKGW